MLTPSTYTRSRARSTRMILPVRPLFLPEITMTSSSVRSFIRASSRESRRLRPAAGGGRQGRRPAGILLGFQGSRTPPGGDQRSPRGRDGLPEGALQHLRGERDDLHEAAVAQLARDRAEDARAARVVLGVDDHGGVLVEGDVGAVLAPELLLRAHDDGLHDIALLDRPLRVGLLDGGRDDVPDARVAAAGAALHADAEDLAGARAVGDLQTCLVLDHLARSSTSTSRQRLLRDIGRHSWMRTVSPVPASLLSSWAW